MTALGGQGEVSFNLVLNVQGFCCYCLPACLKQNVQKTLYFCPSNFSGTHIDFGNFNLTSFVMISVCSLNLQNDRPFSYILRYHSTA